MKKILTLGMTMMLFVAAFAQNNVTQFLGLPVDGTKTAMIQKLKAKGFRYDAKLDVMEGEFNGHDVRLYIVTNNNKVYRIMVTDENGSSEGDIKIRFNTLCKQFEGNGKYIPQSMLADYSIKDDEDISYEMLVHKKRYQAAYYQISDMDKDTTGVTEWTQNEIKKKYGEEKWASMSEEEKTGEALKLTLKYILEKTSHKSVWFMITEKFGRYYINIYYDNEKNQANGEDL